MESRRCARSEAIANEDMMESFRATAIVVREQAVATTCMA